MKRVLLTGAVAAVAVLLSIPGASYYYEAGGGENCARCHEIRPAVDLWTSSSHRNVACGACHGDAFTLDAGFHLTNLRRVRAHLAGEVPEQPRLGEAMIPAMIERCEACHRQEAAAWRAGPHAVNYETLFLDPKHNKERPLMDDCLRCHGMHFEGAIGDLVTPLNSQGPWKLKDAARGKRPAIPCLACHGIHQTGRPQAPRDRQRASRRGEEVLRPSLGLFDRRSLRTISLRNLPLPQMRDGERAVKMSPDPRQALCYQCHAPFSTRRVGSGDDRTPVGVHEGLSCAACHERHRQTTRSSCANCHPRLSNCGRDVETMDTTFGDPKSRHNVHWVKCADCHPKGVPARKPRAAD